MFLIVGQVMKRRHASFFATTLHNEPVIFLHFLEAASRVATYPLSIYFLPVGGRYLCRSFGDLAWLGEQNEHGILFALYSRQISSERRTS